MIHIQRFRNPLVMKIRFSLANRLNSLSAIIVTYLLIDYCLKNKLSLFTISNCWSYIKNKECWFLMKLQADRILHSLTEQEKGTEKITFRCNVLHFYLPEVDIYAGPN